MNKIHILLGIVVNFIWGLAFLVPYYLSNTNPVLITFGRYFVYGVLSLGLLLMSATGVKALTRMQWGMAFLFAFTGNVGYYFLLTMAIRNAGVAIPALIIGTLPVTIMVYGNLKNKDVRFSRLWPSISLILAGIVGINIFKGLASPDKADTNHLLAGVLYAVAALSVWTWYGVKNSDYLKNNPNLTSANWSLAIGICCLMQSSIVFFAMFLGGNFDGVFSGADGDPLFRVVLGSMILGVLVSWLATIWWNNVSRHLLISLCGQLIVFETISGLIYGYMVDGAMPQIFEVVGAVAIITGVLLGIKSFDKAPGGSA